MPQDKKNPLISVVVLNYNGKELIRECLLSVLHSTYENFEVIFVDNASTDDSLKIAEEILESFPRKKIIRNDKNYFFCEGNNIGVSRAQGEYIVLLNNDVLIDEDLFLNFCEVFKDETIGICQPKVMLYNDRSRLENMGGFIDRFGFSWARGRREIDVQQYDSSQSVFFAVGAVLAVRSSVLKTTGLFDPKFYIYCEDVDLSWRVRLNGYSIIVIPEVKAYHHVGAVTKQESRNTAFKINLAFHFRKNRLAMLLKNYQLYNILLFLPVTVLVYCFVFLKEIIVNRDPEMALTSFRAITWNIRNFNYLHMERKHVQNTIRKVSDREIKKFMLKRPVFFRQC